MLHGDQPAVQLLGDSQLCTLSRNQPAAHALSGSASCTRASRGQPAVHAFKGSARCTRLLGLRRESQCPLSQQHGQDQLRLQHEQASMDGHQQLLMPYSIVASLAHGPISRPLYQMHKQHRLVLQHAKGHSRGQRLAVHGCQRFASWGTAAWCCPCQCAWPADNGNSSQQGHHERLCIMGLFEE
jgi:hypothetical protein